MAFGKVRTFIPIWGAIWVFPPWGRGGTPKTPLHIITFTPLGVRNFQQKFQEILVVNLVWQTYGQCLKRQFSAGGIKIIPE